MVMSGYAQSAILRAIPPAPRGTAYSSTHIDNSLRAHDRHLLIRLCLFAALAAICAARISQPNRPREYRIIIGLQRDGKAWSSPTARWQGGTTCVVVTC